MQATYLNANINDWLHDMKAWNCISFTSIYVPFYVHSCHWVKLHVSYTFQLCKIVSIVWCKYHVWVKISSHYILAYTYNKIQRIKQWIFNSLPGKEVTSFSKSFISVSELKHWYFCFGFFPTFSLPFMEYSVSVSLCRPLPLWDLRRYSISSGQ